MDTDFYRSQGITASELMQKSFPEPKWAIPGILPEGLNILGGKPKKGKSILALNICLDIALGKPALGKIHIEGGSVIYFALEDNYRRLQERMATMLGDDDAPERLTLFNEIRGDDNSKLIKLEQVIKNHDNPRLIVIDTLAKFYPSKSANPNYDEDYKRAAIIKEIADKNKISILLIHHLRKTEADDVMDTFLGSQGLTGAADGLLAMVEGEGQSDSNLIITGRDVEKTAFGLRFNPDTLRWIVLGNASEIRSTPKQQKIADVLEKSTEPLTPKLIAEKTGLREQYVKNTLPKLISEGGIKKTERGLYVLVHQK